MGGRIRVSRESFAAASLHIRTQGTIKHCTTGCDVMGSELPDLAFAIKILNRHRRSKSGCLQRPHR